MTGRKKNERITEGKKIALAGATVALEWLTEGQNRCITVKEIARGIWPQGHLTRSMQEDVKKRIGDIIKLLQPDYYYHPESDNGEVNKKMDESGEVMMPVSSEFFKLSEKKHRSQFTDDELNTCIPGRGRGRQTAGICLADYDDPVFLKYMEHRVVVTKGHMQHTADRATNAVAKNALSDDSLEQIGLKPAGMKRLAR
jgi:hypothetical protein